jgi:hypothetical protein
MEFEQILRILSLSKKFTELTLFKNEYKVLHNAAGASNLPYCTECVGHILQNV